MSDEKTAAAPKKKGKLGKIVLIGVALLVVLGGGIGAGLYVSQSGMFGGEAKAAESTTPQLVLKEDQERVSIEGESDGTPTPEGEGGDKYASSYYKLEKEFTSNLADSVHFVQIGVAVSTPYDKRVIENIRTHEIAVRSAVLMALGETTEEQVFTSQGKRQIQRRLAQAINDTLKEKEGFGGVGNVYFTNFVVQ